MGIVDFETNCEAQLLEFSWLALRCVASPVAGEHAEYFVVLDFPFVVGLLSEFWLVYLH